MVLSEKGIQLKEKLIKIRDEQDFWGAVLCYCNTDKKKEVLLQLLEDAEKADTNCYNNCTYKNHPYSNVQIFNIRKISNQSIRYICQKSEANTNYNLE